MYTTDRTKSLLHWVPIGIILQTPRRTKEPYRLRKARRSRATAQPTQEQPKNEVSPAPHRNNPITSFIPARSLREGTFSGKNEV